jgi:murein L,D-transpeptidase YcbB/YkuD
MTSVGSQGLEIMAFTEEDEPRRFVTGADDQSGERMSFERTHAHSGSHGGAASDATVATPGKRTQVQLAEAASVAQEAKAGHQAPPIGDVRAGHAVLKIGDHGPAVAKVQHLLHQRADGVFDEDLRFAVERFQHKHHLPANGVVGQKTLHAMEHKPHRDHPSGGGNDGGGGGGGGGVIIGGGEG